jgi:hypothetical protein
VNRPLVPILLGGGAARQAGEQVHDVSDSAPPRLKRTLTASTSGRGGVVWAIGFGLWDLV